MGTYSSSSAPGKKWPKRPPRQSQPDNAEWDAVDDPQWCPVEMSAGMLWAMAERILAIQKMEFGWHAGEGFSCAQYGGRYGKPQHRFQQCPCTSKCEWRSKKDEPKAIGRSRGGLTTKIHAVVDGLGNPVEFLLSAGNDHDAIHAIDVLSMVDISTSNILGDKAYGSQKIRTYITQQGASYTIPPQSNVSDPWECDWWLYKERHLVECFFQKIKWFRRVATRYDKSDRAFLGFVYLASIAILVK